MWFRAGKSTHTRHHKGQMRLKPNQLADNETPFVHGLSANPFLSPGRLPDRRSASEVSVPTLGATAIATQLPFFTTRPINDSMSISRWHRLFSTRPTAHPPRSARTCARRRPDEISLRLAVLRRDASCRWEYTSAGQMWRLRRVTQSRFVVPSSSFFKSFTTVCIINMSRLFI
jgi:hypothetical protein